MVPRFVQEDNICDFSLMGRSFICFAVLSFSIYLLYCFLACLLSYLLTPTSVNRFQPSLPATTSGVLWSVNGGSYALWLGRGAPGYMIAFTPTASSTSLLSSSEH